MICPEIRTKKGELMAFLTIEDFTGEIECVAFPSVYEKHKEMLQSDQTVVVKGRLNNRNNEKSLITEAVKAL